MTVKLDKFLLLNTFGVSDFCALTQSISSMAPSLAEYYLASVWGQFEEVYINKKNIAETIYCGNYTIFLDYYDDVFLEHIASNDEDELSLF